MIRDHGITEVINAIFKNLKPSLTEFIDIGLFLNTFISMPLILCACLMFSLDFRGVWIPRWSVHDGERIFTVLDGRFNHVFVQVFALGESWYPSAIAPRREGIDDWLTEFIAEAHRRRIKVSAWVNVLYSWGLAPITGDEKHPIVSHPDWYVSDRDGRSILDLNPDELRTGIMEGYYLAPAHPEVREYLCRISEELARRYDLDGIHFDYIRYPNARFIWDRQIRTKYDRQYYVDPRSLWQSDSVNARFGPAGCEDLGSRWQSVINDDLTSLVAELSRRIKAVKPGMLVSAAVKPDYRSARDEYFQDWISWLNQGSVDFVCLMAYGRSIQPVLNRDLEVLREPQRVIVGLAAYLQDAAAIRGQVSQVKDLPFGGITIFSYEELKKDPSYTRVLFP